MNFSHSSLDKYKECPRKFFFHYIERLRPVTTKSPLFFGSLVDDIAGRIFLEKKKDPNEEEKGILDLSLEEIVEDYLIKWKKDPKLRFSQSDLDLSLLSEEDLDDCINNCQNLNLDVNLDSYKAFLDACKEQLKSDLFGLDVDTQIGYNYFFIKSLKRKVDLFIPIIQDWVEENVQETVSVQELVEISDEDDLIRGRIDIRVIMKDGTEFIWDFKTSSKAYKENQANESWQLTIYSEYAKIKNVGFLVVEKSIRKREPKVRFQEVRGIITEEQSEEVFSEITNLVDEIKEAGDNRRNYPKNEDACWNYGGCVYKSFCKHGKETGLERK